jgi:hypothetical protein
MHRRVLLRRDFVALEERRMRAADLLEQGMPPAEIARRVCRIRLGYGNDSYIFDPFGSEAVRSDLS